MNDWIGYAWLKEHFDIPSTQPLPIMSRIGRDRKSREENGVRYETYRPTSKPDDTPTAHLAFALKHEGVNLDLLARVFRHLDKQELVDWVMREPSGQYARKAGFLYEWVTGEELSVSGMTGNYQNILDPLLYVSSNLTEKSPRWRINNNLPGTPAFCPIIRRTDLLDLVTQYDCRGRLEELENDYGVGMLASSAVWLSIRESQAFVNAREQVKDYLEGPNDDIDRIIRSLETNGGKINNKLRKEFPALAKESVAEPIKEIVADYVANKPEPIKYDPEAEVEALRAIMD